MAGPGENHKGHTGYTRVFSVDMEGSTVTVLRRGMDKYGSTIYPPARTYRNVSKKNQALVMYVLASWFISFRMFVNAKFIRHVELE